MAKVQCTCLYCQEEFSVELAKINAGGGIYCSRKCCGLARTTLIERECEVCHTKFFKKPSKIAKGRGRFCSIECKQVGLAREKRYCLVCGKELFEQRHYCSKQCEGIARSGENNHRWRGGSRSQYRGDNWAEQRKLAYERDGGICQHCGKEPRIGQRKFDVHHIKPYIFCSDYLEANRLENLIVLCRACHAKAENGSIIIQPKLL